MKTLIAGAIAAAIGLILLAVWFGEFTVLLKGAIPAILLLGGALAIYLGFDEVKDSLRQESDEKDIEAPKKDVDKYEKEITELKKELNTLKKEPAAKKPVKKTPAKTTKKATSTRTAKK